MRKVIAFLSILLICFGIMFTISPVRIAIANKLGFVQQKVDDATSYKTIKEVEDTCRAMIASYEADRLVWEQYRDDTNSEKLSWAEQAKMRANKTASSYNNYILKNSFVWSGNVPGDIQTELELLH